MLNLRWLSIAISRAISASISASSLASCNNARRALLFRLWKVKKKTKNKHAPSQGYLVAFLQVFHQDGHHHVHQHKLGHEHEGDKVQWGHQGQVGEAVAVLFVALPQRVLKREGDESGRSSLDVLFRWLGFTFAGRIFRKLKVLSHIKHSF